MYVAQLGHYTNNPHKCSWFLNVMHWYPVVIEHQNKVNRFVKLVVGPLKNLLPLAFV